MATTTRRIDPDPFGIIVGIAGILGGIVAAIELYDRYVRSLPSNSLRKIKGYIINLEDELEYLLVDLRVIQDILHKAKFPYGERFQPISSIMISPDEFERYANAANRVLDRLRRILRLVHRLERSLVSLPEAEIFESKKILMVRETIEGILWNKNIAIIHALDEVIKLIKMLQDLVLDTKRHHL